MKTGVRTELGTTASLAAFLQWTSHYAQSPLTAVAGYLDMLGDPKHRAQRTELLSQAQAATSRVQQVLMSIAALHRQLESASVTNQVDAIDKILVRAVQSSGMRIHTPRQRTVPLVCIEGGAAFDGLGLLFAALKAELHVAHVEVRYRQRGSEFIVHLGFAKQGHNCSSVLFALCAMPDDRYPLVEGRYSGLATAVVLMRAAGLRCVMRPRSTRRTDVYLHARLPQQLSLVDMGSDLG
jgi:hypothetical protein